MGALIEDICDFLVRLSQNNNRPWFQEHKEEYVSLNERFHQAVDEIIARMRQYDSTLNSLTAKECVYRIYRDVRFSPDKSPYKRHFGAIIVKGGRRSVQACYYLHIEPGNSGLYGGLWCPDSDMLARLRSLLDADGQELMQIIEAPEFSSKYTLVGQKLKKVPRGYTADNENAELLKMKEVLFEYRPGDDYFKSADWTEKVAHDFEPLKRANDFLNYIFE